MTYCWYFSNLLLWPILLANANNSCTRSWPSLELWLPVHLSPKSRRNNEVFDFFFRSFLLFWPLEVSKTTLRVVLDEEVKDTPLYNHTWTTLQQKLAKHPSYRPDLLTLTLGMQSPYYKEKGYDRQQWMMFWADNYSTSEYVGFVDADCVFITSIDREDLFEDGKPVVNGRIGINKRPPWSQAPATTYQMTGLLEPMRCMSYFPVIVKTAHFVELRKFISRQHHNQSFNDVFLQMISNGTYYSQFNIMCTYLYHYHRQDYRWYVHDTHPLDCRYCMDKKWKGVRPKPNKGELWTGDRSLYEPYMFLPKGRVAVHARYHGDLPGGDPNPRTNIVNTPKLLDSLLRRGYCESPPYPKVTTYKPWFH